MSNTQEQMSGSQIKKGAIISYITIFINIVLGFIYTPWMLRQIGDSNYGIYTLATTLISMFTLDFGMSAAVSRFVSIYHAKGDQDGVNNFLGMAYKLYTIITVVILIALIIVFFVIDQIYATFSVQELQTFKIVYVIAACSTIITFPFITLNGILTSYEEFFALKTCELIQKLSGVVLTIVLLLMGKGLYALVTVNAFVAIGVIIVKLIIIHMKTPVKVNIRYHNKTVIKSIFSFSVWSTVASMAQRLIFNIMPTIIGMVTGTAQITMFSLSSSIEGYLWNISQGINGLFLPKVSRIAVNDNCEKNMLELMIKVGRINLSIVGVVIMGFAVLGKEFVINWVGEAYENVYICALCMMLPALFSQPKQIANTAVIAFNKVKIQAIIMAVTSVINLILAFILLKYIGIIGCGISIFVAYMLRVIAMDIVYYKELHLNLRKFYVKCYLKMIPGIAIVFIIACVIDKCIPLYNWKGLIIKACFIGLVYIIVMWLIAWNDYEKNIVKSVVKDLKNRGKK